MPLFGPPDVDKAKAKRDVPGLIKALGYEKDRSLGAPAVRTKAAGALGGIGDPRAVEPLITALSDLERGVRQAAARGAGETRLEPGWDRGRSRTVREAAAAALQRLGVSRDQ